MTRRRLRSAIFALSISAFVGAPAGRGVAHAQSTEKDADAERLFREGQKLMEERRFGEACPKFEAAYRKDQQLGTLLNLAYCHKEQGAIWPAWLEFKEAEVKAVTLKRLDRRDFAKQRMTELEKNLARVVIDPTTKVELTEILVEDRRVFEAEKGVSFAAEPGKERKITFLAKGKKPTIQLIAITAPKKNEGPQHVTVPEMEDLPKEVAPVVVAPSPPPPPTRAAPPAPPPSSGWRTAMWVSLGVGVPLVAVGSVLGVLTLTSDCTTTGRASNEEACPRGGPERADASTRAAISTVTLVVGSAATAFGLGVLIFGPSGSGKSQGAAAASRFVLPAVGPTWAGLRGRF